MKKSALFASCMLVPVVLVGCGATTTPKVKGPDAVIKAAAVARDKTKMKGYAQMEEIANYTIYADQLKREKGSPQALQQAQAQIEQAANTLKRLGLTAEDKANLEKYWEFDPDYKYVRKRQ